MTDHDTAMDLAEQADRLWLAGNDAAAQPIYEQALALARGAAESEQTEPSRGIMLSSAGWLAINAGQPEEALRLADLGLAGRVPERVAANLRWLASEACKRMEAK